MKDAIVISALAVNFILSIISILKATGAKRNADKLQMKGLQSENNTSEEIKAINSIGIVRYNAFPELTGDYSTSAALINDKEDGIVITSIHGADGCSTYIKEIKKGRCEVPLSLEEVKALNKAANQGKDEENE